MIKLKEKYRNLELKKPLYIKDDQGRDVMLQLSKVESGFEVRRPYGYSEEILNMDFIFHIATNENPEVSDVVGKVMLQNIGISDHDTRGHIFSIPRKNLNANEAKNLGLIPSIIAMENPSLISKLEILQESFLSDIYAYLLDSKNTHTSIFGIINILNMPKSDKELKQVIADNFSHGLTLEQKQILNDYISVESNIISNRMNVAIMIYDSAADLIPTANAGVFEYFIDDPEEIIQQICRLTIPIGTAEFHLANTFIAAAIPSVYTQHSR